MLYGHLKVLPRFEPRHKQKYLVLLVNSSLLSSLFLT